jgi:putative FmdB family regulatory protein
MPVYSFSCDDCGEFNVLRPVSEAGLAASCPECGGPAYKVWSSVHLRSMSPGVRKAHETNERSANAPHVCGAGCSHGPAKKTAVGDRPVLQRSTKKNSRPWMLGH